MCARPAERGCSHARVCLCCRYAREAEIESDIIRALQRTLPTDGSFPIVQLHRTFESKGCVQTSLARPEMARDGAHVPSRATAALRILFLRVSPSLR